MKLLVLGRNGQVAKELAALTDTDIAVTCIGRDDADLMTDAGVERAERTVADGFDAVVNAAAYTAVDGAESDLDAATQLNVIVPSRLSRAAQRAGIPFVHLSTDYVFPGSGEAPWTTRSPVAPINAYGQTKAAGEHAVHGSMAAFAILRTSWVFSAHGSNFVKTMLRLADTRSTLSIVADQIGGPTPARAIAAACVTISARLRDAPDVSGIYHFSGAPDVSWADFARSIFRQSGHELDITDIPTASYPTPARRPLNSRLLCDETFDTFGVSRPDWEADLGAVLKELGERA